MTESFYLRRFVYTPIIFAASVFFLHEIVASEQGADNPTGVSGVFNGNVTTGGSYDPYTGNAIRVVDDLVVPGSVGAYPLKWTRYFNSHTTTGDSSRGGQWRFSYIDYAYEFSGRHMVWLPDGRALDPGHSNYGVEEWMEEPWPYSQGILHLRDGGKVIFDQIPGSGNAGHYNVSKIVDPYGLETTIVRKSNGDTQITEPGGRYLLVTSRNGVPTVEAYDGIAGHDTPIDSVTYTWNNNFTLHTTDSCNTTTASTTSVLTKATYADGTEAKYTYIAKDYQVTARIITLQRALTAVPSRPRCSTLAMMCGSPDRCARSSTITIRMETPRVSPPKKTR
jgi:hypothetical protein